MRIGFTRIGGSNWTGGSNYLKNLLVALSLRGAGHVEPIVFLCPDVPGEVEAELAGIPGVEIHRIACGGWWRRRWRLARALVSGRDPLVHRLIVQYRLDAMFEAAEFFGRRIGVPAIAWIPDFQHRLLRDQFSWWGYWQRELGFRIQIASDRTVMLSSEDAMSICRQYYKTVPERFAVVRFAVLPGVAPTATEARAIADTYDLPEHFFFLPNQFWRHKNHLLVVEALALLRQRGVAAVIAASGRAMDHRHPTHYAELTKRVSDLQISSQFRLLGMVARSHLMPLMCASDAVLNPSLSEGWSTTVEEARSLGVPLVLSDLAVHREQAGTDAVYFNRHDPASLADALQHFMLPSAAQRRDRTRVAQADASARVAQFGADFEAVVTQAVLRAARAG